MASYEELAEEALRNEPGLVPPPNEPFRLTVRPLGVSPPPVNDVNPGEAWGAPNEAGRPSGRLFEPDQTPYQPPAPERALPWLPRTEQQLGGLGRGLGALVEGARDWWNAPPSQPAPPNRSPMGAPPLATQGPQRGSFAPVNPMAGVRPDRYDVPKEPPLGLRAAGGVVDMAEDVLKIPSRFFQAANVESNPGSSWQDVDLARQQQVKAAADATMNLAGVGTAFAAARPGASAGIFGGSLSKSADLPKRQLAEAMEGNGLPPNRIWRETGWMRGADNKWMNEISDLEAFYTGNHFKTQLKIQQGEQLYLPDVIHHPQLYKAYPELRQMPVSQDATMWAYGSYQPRGPNNPASIAYRPDDKEARGQVFKTLLHEIQHGIQQIEGFAKGSNTSQMQAVIPGTGANKLFNKGMKSFAKPMSEEDFLSIQKLSKSKDGDTYAKYMEDYNKRYKDYEAWLQKYSAEQAYPRSAGEELANTVMQRPDFTPQQAAAVYPGSQMKHPFNEQFVEFNSLTGPSQAQMGGILKPRPNELELPQMSAPLLRGKAADEAWRGVEREPKLNTTTHPFSNVGGTPISTMDNPIIKGSKIINPRTIDIEKDLANAELIFGAGDATGAGGKLHGSKNLPFEQPVGRHGGPGYASNMLGKKIEGHPGASPVWASMKGPMGEILNIARDVESRGKVPWLTYMTGGKQYLDSSMQMVDTALQAAKSKGVSTTANEHLVKVMQSDWNTAANSKLPFPETGLKDEVALRAWIEASPQPQRAKLVKAMDTKTARDLGFPNIGELRVWNTDPRMITAPPGSAGLTMSRLYPSAGTVKSHHPAYDTAVAGTDVATLGMQVPHEIIAPTMHASRMATLKKPEYYQRAPHLYFPGGGTHATKTEPVTNAMKDRLQEWMRKHPGGLAVAGTAGAGAAGIGSLVDPSRYEAR